MSLYLLSYVCPCCFSAPSYARIDGDQRGSDEGGGGGLVLHDLQVDDVSEDEIPVLVIDDDPPSPITIPLNTLPPRLTHSTSSSPRAPTLPPLILPSTPPSIQPLASPFVLSPPSDIPPPFTTPPHPTSFRPSQPSPSRLPTRPIPTPPSTSSHTLSSHPLPPLHFSYPSTPSHHPPFPPSPLPPPLPPSTVDVTVGELEVRGEDELDLSKFERVKGEAEVEEKRPREEEAKEMSQEEAETNARPRGFDELKEGRVEEGEEEEEVKEGVREVRVVQLAQSPVLSLLSPRRRPVELLPASPTLTSSSVASSHPSPAPSFAPSSPPSSHSHSSSSSPPSPSSALLSSSFSSTTSATSLSSSSLLPLSSPHSSPKPPPHPLAPSHPPPIQLDPRLSPPFTATPHRGVDHPILPTATLLPRRRSSTSTTTTTTHSSAIPPPHPPHPAAVPPSAKPLPLSLLPVPLPIAPPVLSPDLPAPPPLPLPAFKPGENPLLALNIPQGELTPSSIESLISLFSPSSTTTTTTTTPLLSHLASHLTYLHLFDFVISAPRRLSSATFRHFSQPILARARASPTRPSPNAQIGLLLLRFFSNHLSSITTTPHSLNLAFTFPSAASSHALDVPTPDMFVLESKHPTDPTLVHPLNVLKKADSDVRRMVFARVVRVMIERGRGVVGVGAGDVSVKKVFAFGCDMRYERRVGMVDVDGSGRQVVEDRGGKVVVKSGHYVLARYDDWLIVTVLNQQVMIGLPPFTKVNEA